MDDNFKKSVRDKVKQYSTKSYLDGYIENEFLTKDGDADIFLNVDSINDIIDSRTIGVQKDLNKDVYDFIEDKSSMLDNDTKINFHIVGLDLNSKEQGEIKHIFKEHYAIELYKVQKEYVKCRNKILGMFLFGILMLVAYFTLYNISEDFLLFEILSFMFSFSLWEAFDLLLFSLSDIKYNREEIGQNLLTELSFESNSKID